MKKLLFIFILAAFNSLSQCACVWMDASGNMQCQVYANCGNPNFQDCRNKVTSSSLWASNCPIPPGSSCNPGMYNTAANGACWYQGAGCSANAVCNYVISLPVELVDYSASNVKGSNVISWKTVSEYNSAYFRIEHSLDGINFSHFISISAAENSTEEVKYYIYHQDYTNVVNYYSLYQIDKDGAEKYYGIVAVNNIEKADPIIKFTDVLGRSVDSEYTGIVFIHYESGKIEKIWKGE